MKKIRLIVDFIYDEDFIRDDDQVCTDDEAEENIINLMATELLNVHSNSVGLIGEMQVLAFHVGEVEHFDEDENV